MESETAVHERRYDWFPCGKAEQGANSVHELGGNHTTCGGFGRSRVRTSVDRYRGLIVVVKFHVYPYKLQSPLMHTA